MSDLIERLVAAANRLDSDGDEHNASNVMYEAACELRSRPAGPAWLTMDSCPVGEEVLLWNQETQEMFFGYRPEDAPSVDCVVTASLPTAAYADAWMPKPAEPEAETQAPEGVQLRAVPSAPIPGIEPGKANPATAT